MSEDLYGWYAIFKSGYLLSMHRMCLLEDDCVMVYTMFGSPVSYGDLKNQVTWGKHYHFDHDCDVLLSFGEVLLS